MKIIDLIGEKEDFGIKEFEGLLKIYGEDWWQGKWQVKVKENEITSVVIKMKWKQKWKGKSKGMWSEMQ